jgi:hypothetical protein
MKFPTFLVFLILFSHILKAQPSNQAMNDQTVIGNLTPNTLFTLDSSVLSTDNEGKDKNEILYRIPIKFWIYRRSNGNDGMTINDMKDQIWYINFFHSINNTGIQFYLSPDFEFIDKDRLFRLNYLTQAPLQTFLKHSKGCINVHVPGKLSQSRLIGKPSHYAGTYNRMSKGVLMAYGVSCPTLTHETGHYLGLKHTHKHWKSRFLQEPVDRDRTLRFSKKKACEKRGDDLCDTPAEPNLDVYTDNYCNFTGQKLTDKYGDHYLPFTDNLMSYSQNRECRTTFSKGQIKRMHERISKSKYGKIWSTSNENALLTEFDTYEPDDFREIASEIFFNTPQNRTFHKIVSSKRKFKFEDQSDWLFFEFQDTQKKTLKLIFSENKYKFPDISITVFKDDKQILEKIINNEQAAKIIELPVTKTGKYFIKISQINNSKTITAYKITIVK